MDGNMIQKKEKLKEQCDILVGSLLGHNADLCDMWWKTQNQAFNFKSPQEVFDGDGASEVYNYLMHHAFVGGGS
jgi:hypothetical protein